MLLKEGDMRAQTDARKEKLKDAHVFLFQRAVIIARAVKGGYETRTVIDLNKRSSLADVSMWEIADGSESTCAWSLKSENYPDIMFAVDSLVVKHDWMEEMNAAIKSAPDESRAASLPVSPPTSAAKSVLPRQAAAAAASVLCNS